MDFGTDTIRRGGQVASWAALIQNYVMVHLGKMESESHAALKAKICVIPY